MTDPESMVRAQEEREHLKLLCAGDAQAFEVLVEHTRDALWRVARGMSEGDAQAQDLLQECYTIAYTSLLKKTWDGQSAYTWLRKVLVRLAMRRTRRQQSWRRVLRIVGASATPTATSHDHALPLYLHRALVQLPPAQRAALILKVLEEATQREIAYALECSEGAVEQLLVRARRTLRNTLSSPREDS